MGGGKGEIESNVYVHAWTCHALHLVPCTLWKNRESLLKQERLLIRYMYNRILDVIFCLSKQYVMHAQVLTS